MKLVERLELPLWELLQAAAIAPDEADIRKLLDGLEVALLELDMPGQLQVAAEAIQQIAQVFQERSALAFEELDATSEEGPGMPTDAFDLYVRQTMEVDFESFIEPLASLPRKIPERSGPSELGSVVGELDRAAVLQALNEQMSQQPELTEADVFNQTLALAHDEDASRWVWAIAQWLKAVPNNQASFKQLCKSLEIPQIEVWLGVLFGGFELEAGEEFYSDALWVKAAVVDP